MESGKTTQSHAANRLRLPARQPRFRKAGTVAFPKFVWSSQSPPTSPRSASRVKGFVKGSSAPRGPAGPPLGPKEAAPNPDAQSRPPSLPIGESREEPAQASHIATFSGPASGDAAMPSLQFRARWLAALDGARCAARLSRRADIVGWYSQRISTLSPPPATCFAPSSSLTLVGFSFGAEPRQRGDKIGLLPSKLEAGHRGGGSGRVIARRKTITGRRDGNGLPSVASEFRSHDTNTLSLCVLTSAPGSSYVPQTTIKALRGA
ncbi:hypothetical protein VDGL01_01714 [Verticillium dahliae]